ncbi:VapE domain-containing protein [Sphingobium lignivorans]|uniref:P-loop ATPase n=1 Tax=Sphingobium lignivorans TaxID=2735886 RepID=A0ABR6NFF1_9SPHN|nr:VapE domain-containing protein [Sphingobium lignivorans]MBB5986005.1 putative P-loop ATPase [Sphingobium lignivorans]
MLDQIAPFVRAGFAVHWLAPRSKRPIKDNWSDIPVATLDALRASYRDGLNAGVRLGEPSQVEGGYLHVLDVDIRVPDMVEEAMAKLLELFPDAMSFPSVISGSGGASRHLYFVTEKPFRSRRLAASAEKFRRFDKAQDKDVWSCEWEVELFGSGKQVVLPPSIHPNTGEPYRWERPFDLDMLDLGFGPLVSASHVEALGVVEDAAYAFEAVPPLDFKPGQMERDLDAIDVSDLHYDDWIRLGQAIHHQMGGSQEGFDLWLHHTKRSKKYTGDRQDREMRRIKWRSFGRYRGRPVTMATIRQWAQDARAAAMAAELDDLDDLDDDTAGSDDDAQSSKIDEEFADLLGVEADSLDDDDADEFDKADAKAPKDETPDLEWKSLLEITEEGGIKATLHNIRLLVANDVRFTGVMQFNEFTQEVVQRGVPGVKPSRKKSAKPTLQLDGPSWSLRDNVNGDFWTEDKDNAIRSLIEAPKTQGGYSIKVSDRDLRAAIDITARKSAFHPVREYLNTLEWDGVPRLERLFVDYLGAPDDAYTRSVARLILTAGVTRVYEPGAKFDSAVILQGLQGKRKSTFISILAKSWFAELEGEFEDARAMVEAMQGAWILEMPELGGFVRADVRHIKAFLSRRSDKVRLAYAKRAQEFHRQCIFFGSTNDFKYLKDDTGNRRFWPIVCEVDSIDTDRLEREVDQLWAEAVVHYREMRRIQPRGVLPLYLAEAEAQDIAARLQESARVETVEDAMAGQIEAWLDAPIRSGSIDGEDEGQIRKETCLVEIWCEALERERKDYTQQNAQMLGRAMAKLSNWEAPGSFITFKKGIGRQRVYRRKELRR